MKDRMRQMPSSNMRTKMILVCKLDRNSSLLNLKNKTVQRSIKDSNSSKFLGNSKNLEISMDRLLKIFLMIRHRPKMFCKIKVRLIDSRENIKET